MLNTSLTGNVVESSGNTCAINFTTRQDPPLNISDALIQTSLAKDPSAMSPQRKPDEQAAQQQKSALSPPRKPVEQAPQHQKAASQKSPVQSSHPAEKSPKPSPAVSQNQSGTKLTIAPASPPGKEFEARVSVVNSPSDFYLALQTSNPQNEQAMQKLKQDLLECYADSTPDASYQPQPGNFVVATRKGTWGRAEVVEVDAAARVKLLFVDYGIQDAVEISAVREISERFTTPSMMALHCTLADIVAPGHKPWKPDTINTVREKVCIAFDLFFVCLV